MKKTQKPVSKICKKDGAPSVYCPNALTHVEFRIGDQATCSADSWQTGNKESSFQHDQYVEKRTHWREEDTQSTDRHREFAVDRNTMGWLQRFDRCQTRLILRVGGINGPVICWRDRGMGGLFTWTPQDPPGEVRDLSPWLGNSERVRLYALLIDDSSDGIPPCEMTTLYDDTVCQQWRFDSDEDYEIARPSS